MQSVLYAIHRGLLSQESPTLSGADLESVESLSARHGGRTAAHAEDLSVGMESGLYIMERIDLDGQRSSSVTFEVIR